MVNRVIEDVVSITDMNVQDGQEEDIVKKIRWQKAKKDGQDGTRKVRVKNVGNGVSVYDYTKIILQGL